MLVIQRNGKTTVITGWRAWLIGAVVFASVSLLMGLIVFVALGVAVTIGAILLIVIPVIAGIAIIASVFQSAKR